MSMREYVNYSNIFIDKFKIRNNPSRVMRIEMKIEKR